MTQHTTQEIEEILEAVARDPMGFRELANRLRIPTTDREIVRSMQSWGIDPWDRDRSF
jgi:DNA-binding IclR family transcriptional regulator